MMQKVFNWVITGMVVILLVSVIAGSHAKSPVGSGQYNLTQDSYADGLQVGDNAEKWITKTMSPGANSVLLYTNNTGREVYVNYGTAVIPTGSTASSTFKVSMFATTSTSVAVTSDFDALAGNTGKASLINGVLIATSSTATTTSSTYAVAVSKGNGTVIVPAGSSVFGYLQANQATVTGCLPSVAGVCEAATSTNRGFNPIFDIKIYKRDMQGF